MRIIRLAEVDSTQRAARDLALQGAPHGTVVLAERQTAGRGRLDRRWESAEGLDLAFSVVLRPGGSVRDAALLSLGAAAGLAGVLNQHVKWPNDVVSAHGRKLAGLLAECDSDGERVRFVILGVGLNVNRTTFDGLPDATSLALERGASLEREAVLRLAVTAVLEGCEHPERLERWRARAHTLGRHVRVGQVEGTAEGLRDDGALIVGGVAVTTGEVALVGAFPGAVGG